MSDGTEAEKFKRLWEEAKQRAEIAEKERERERQRAERSEKGRVDAEKGREDAEKGRERERQRAERSEKGRVDAEKGRERERQRAERSEQQSRRTTLQEYIAACHTSVFSRLTIETDPKFTSKGSITNPKDKWCPTTLQPWPDFLEQQRYALGNIYDTFPTETRVFESKLFLDSLGDRVSKRRIVDERALEWFLHTSVEDPVRNIFEQLKAVPNIRSKYNIGDGIIFENHPHAISDIAEEVLESATPSTPPGQQVDLHQLRADQICIYRSDSAHSPGRTMIYVSEYKPPHKLTAPHLRLGLRPMNIYKEVVQRETIPTSIDPDARFQYFAEKLTASAITQTYHYMIEGGLEYSLLTTGEVIVFLKIDWSDPGTLCYHLAEPDPEVKEHPNHLDAVSVVAQYLAFTLLALGVPGERQQHGQMEREKAKLNLNKWATDFETMLHTIPRDERKKTPEGSLAPKPRTYKDFEREPIILRWGRKSRATQNRCNDTIPPRQNPAEESSDDESSPKPPETPTPAGRATRQSQRILAQKTRDGGGSEGGEAGVTEAAAEAETSPKTADHRDRPYCTQRCLLGMVRGRKLDQTCPNLDLHRLDRNPKQARHPVNHKQWLNMLQEQLKESLDDGITPLGLGGARGVLFKVTLLTYGYTFVGKGTVRVFIKDLEHEAAVYKRLQPIQGVYVPVFLGAIDLRLMNKIYYYDHRVYVVHVTFLSWGGCEISEPREDSNTKESLEQQATLSLQALHRLGVLHRDVRRANMLVNSETGGVMMIDFERAELPKRSREHKKHIHHSGKEEQRVIPSKE
ncbi:Protein kinase-like domain [Cordyceps militaris CM01]|uniref:EKC/KEOPS complex subunit BUD32 n=1 Tax=Cordyceps militaris (strain CM01) TaxID=983644 RepID=G3JDZ9_CORMM|nr:Protein kinase-like domain [Cordyceps militaris CM01]EGX92824.1 Protein kinase-like domain [Cordyceps militaris CM01]